MDEQTSVAYIDTQNVMLAVVTMILIAFMFLVGQQAPKSQDDSKDVFMVEAIWPDSVDADVDLWVRAPGEQPVGYSAKNGKTLDLLRDDLGFANDRSGLNYETVVGRASPSGVWVVNLHLYRAVTPPPIPVRVVVTRRHNDVRSELFVRDVTLERQGQELTVVRFELDDSGNVVVGSTNTIPTPLREAK